VNTARFDFIRAHGAVALAKHKEQVDVGVVKREELTDARVEPLARDGLGRVARVPELELALLHGVETGRKEEICAATPHDARGSSTSGVGLELIYDRTICAWIHKPHVLVQRTGHECTAVVVPRDTGEGVVRRLG
jgi:hypothetical protein